MNTIIGRALAIITIDPLPRNAEAQLRKLEAQAIQVKRAGNFNKLLVIRISEEFEFEAKLIDRNQLKKGKGKYAQVSWGSESYYSKG